MASTEEMGDPMDEASGPASAWKVDRRERPRRLGTVFLAGLFATLLPVGPLRAAPEPDDRETPPEGYVVDALFIEGLQRTNRASVRRLLGFEVGERVTVEELDRAMARLRETGAFHDIDRTLLNQTVPLPDGTSRPSDHRVLHLDLGERWTTLPVLSLDRTGALESFTVGVRDTNAFGSFLELGARYRRLASTNGVEVWAHTPYLLTRRLSASIELGWTNRPRRLYAGTGRLEGGYLRRRLSARAAATWSWSEDVATGLSVQGIDDRFSLDVVSPNVAELQHERGLPPDQRYLAPGLHIQFGGIDPEGALLRGTTYRHDVSRTWPVGGAGRPTTQTGGEVKFFEILPLSSNLAGRFSYGLSDAVHPEQKRFIGGLSDVRGFLDSRFRGRHYWFANLEWRLPSIDRSQFVLQHVAFADATGVAERASQMWEADGVTTGTGLRTVFPEFHDFTLRFDFGWPLLGEGRSTISFGTGQHF